MVDAILHVTRTGCSGRQLPHDFPPWATVLHYFQRWHPDGTTDRNHAALCDAARGAEGAIRPPRPGGGLPVGARCGDGRGGLAAVTPASG